MSGYDGPGKSIGAQLVDIGVHVPEGKSERSRFWEFLLSPLLNQTERQKRQEIFLAAQARFLGKRVRRVKENEIIGMVRYLDIKRNQSFRQSGRPELNSIFEAYVLWENGSRGYCQTTMIEPTTEGVVS